MLLYVAFFLTIFLLTLKWLKRGARQLKGKPIPSHHGLPVIGMGLELNESNMAYKFEKLAYCYGDIFSVNMFGRPLVVLNTEALMRDAYCSEKYAKYFNDKPNLFYTRYFRPSGDSVAFATKANGSLYKKLKKTYIKALHTYGSGVKELEDKILIELESVRNKIESMEMKEFDFTDFLSRSLTNIISLVLVGEMIPEGDASENWFWQKIAAVDFFCSQYAEIILSIIPSLRLFPFTRFGKVFRDCITIDRQITEKYFHSVKKVHREGNAEGIVNFYLEEQRKQILTGNDVFLTDDRIVSQIFESIEAGINTTSSLITNSMLILLNHPECQVKIQEEIDRVIGHDRMPTITDRALCPYIRAFEMEVHRYSPVLPLLSPHICNEDIEFNGYLIKKDSMIVANVWFVQHDERIWGDPWNFRPERFLDENGDLLPSEHRFCRNVLPFGLGERRCVGGTFAKTRYFLYMTTLLQHNTFETSEGCELRSCDPRNKENFEIKVTMRPKPFKVRAVERKLR